MRTTKLTADKLLPLLFSCVAIGAFLVIEPAFAKSSIGIGSGEVTPQPGSGLLGILFLEVTYYQRTFFTALRHALIGLRASGD